MIRWGERGSKRGGRRVEGEMRIFAPAAMAFIIAATRL